MREYEAAIVLSPELEDEGVNKIVGQAGETIGADGGELMLTGQLINRKGNLAEDPEEWKARKLAYPIGHRTEGYYVVLRFNAAPAVPQELERQWGLNESVLRYLVLRADEL